VSAERDAALAACARQDGAELQHPFGPRTAVFKIAGKIFALVDLGDDRGSVSLKCDPEHGEVLRAEHASIVPGYHLNKRHWITAELDGSVPRDLLEELIEDSYDLVAPRRRKAPN
jgi:predicted DNA-binding protein (MmcQ/YjbR family)